MGYTDGVFTKKVSTGIGVPNYPLALVAVFCTAFLFTSVGTLKIF